MKNEIFLLNPKEIQMNQLDYVSLVNLWCRNNKKQYPSYFFKKEGDMWVSMLIAPWVNKYTNAMQSGKFINQKLAQCDVAKIVKERIDVG